MDIGWFVRGFSCSQTLAQEASIEGIRRKNKDIGWFVFVGR
jgi:hypothetical protein